MGASGPILRRLSGPANRPRAPAARPKKSHGAIAFQGEAGADSDVACRAAYPGMATLPCDSFEDVFAAVEGGKARLAMIPIENSVAGRVGVIGSLLPHTGLRRGG